MTDATDMDEYDTVLGVMIAEREDDRTKLNAAQLGIVRHLARLTISDDPKDAKILADLLPLAPHVIRPGAMPPLTLERMDRDDAPLDISAPFDVANLTSCLPVSGLYRSMGLKSLS
jgi:hypothetical protein